MLCLGKFLPPAYEVRWEGNIFSLSVCSPEGGSEESSLSRTCYHPPHPPFRTRTEYYLPCLPSQDQDRVPPTHPTPWPEPGQGTPLPPLAHPYPVRTRTGYSHPTPTLPWLLGRTRTEYPNPYPGPGPASPPGRKCHATCGCSYLDHVKNSQFSMHSRECKFTVPNVSKPERIIIQRSQGIQE